MDHLVASSDTSWGGELSCSQSQKSLSFTSHWSVNVLNQGLTNYGPKTNSGPLPVFVNKVYIMSEDMFILRNQI